MNIHEYQAMALFERYGIPMIPGQVVSSVDEACALSKRLGEGRYVVKAQVHSGGRGKAGGVKIASGREEIVDCVRQILGMRLVTKQTGPKGRTVRKVLVTRCSTIRKEYYLSLALDGANECVKMIASSEGGMEIEQLAADCPDRIYTESIDPGIGLKRFQSQKMAKKLGLDGALEKQFVKVTASLYRMFRDLDCSLIEINPLCVDDADNLIALDAKINFDDNALFRHKDIQALRDLNEEDPKEIEASRYDLNYVQLDGNIACMVNGAGLAMATMDIIEAYGGKPSNFLDVGGGATAEKIAGAFGILLSDENVKAIFINIFGGIMKCDIIAQGIVSAAKEKAVDMPLVVRLEGTHSEAGKRILKESGLNIYPANDMAEGVRLACSMAC